MLLDGAKKPIKDRKYKHKAAYFNRVAAEKTFIRQLGKVWGDDLEELQPHERAMFGVMAAMACIDRKGAMEALREMNMTWREITSKNGPTSYTVETKKGEELAKKYWDDPTVKAARVSHGYFYTVISALADQKNNSGELCCSHFIWLRPTDPRLFYVLHQQGLPLPNYEAAGPYAHYQTELRLGFPQKKPLISKAVEGLKQGLVEEGWLTSHRPPESPSVSEPNKKPELIVEEAEAIA